MSVIIPTYNRRNFLDQTIKCCTAQTLADIEFIIIDDGSTDGSYTYLKERVASDKHFILKRRKVNRGPYYCRNVGLKEAKGKYIGFFDCDDIIPPDYFEKLYLSAIKNKAEIVYTCYNDHSHTLTNLTTLKDRFDELRNGALWDKIYKASFLQKYNLRFKEGLYTADNIFIAKSFYYAKRIALVNEPKYQWIKRKDSIGKDTTKQDKRKHDILHVLRQIIIFAWDKGLSGIDLEALKSFCERSLKSYKNDEQFVRSFNKILNMQIKKINRKESIMLSFLKLARLMHFISKDKYNEKRQITLIEKSPLFDKKWYLSQNPDVKKRKMKAAKHYLKKGYKEGRNPSPYFDGNDYLKRYKGVAKKGYNPLIHYLLHGAKEGRSYKPAVKGMVLEQRSLWDKIKSALTYPIRVKEEYDRLKVEIKMLKHAK